MEIAPISSMMASASRNIFKLTGTRIPSPDIVRDEFETAVGNGGIFGIFSESTRAYVDNQEAQYNSLLNFGTQLLINNDLPDSFRLDLILAKKNTYEFNWCGRNRFS